MRKSQFLPKRKYIPKKKGVMAKIAGYLSWNLETEMEQFAHLQCEEICLLLGMPTNQSINPHKNLCRNVHSSVIHDS